MENLEGIFAVLWVAGLKVGGEVRGYFEEKLGRECDELRVGLVTPNTERKTRFHSLMASWFGRCSLVKL
jgi:hypothetical protein